MSELDPVFERLKGILALHAEDMEVVTDVPGNYYVNTAKPDEKGKPVFFGMVKAGKGGISYHLMPVYCHPELLDGISEALHSRMQGKSCFQFSQEDDGLFGELATLTQRGLERYDADGKI